MDLIAPPTWLVTPFIVLLAMIATGPLLYPRWWHRWYPFVSIVLGGMVILYYLAVLNDSHHPVQTAFEFVSFITVIIALYVVSGCITITVRYEATPFMNVLFLLIAAVMSNFIGTEGASMLLIRPFIRMNRFRLRPYLIIFFIFIVCNVAGGLTPIGDPPIFMGFLKGVPFFWSLVHLWLPTLVATALLLLIFFLLDKRNTTIDPMHVVIHHQREILIKGKGSFLWYPLIIGAVFLDPTIVPGLPTIPIEGKEFSFIRECVMIVIAALALGFADKKHLVENELHFEPIREVGFLFIGIFATMMPALQMMAEFAIAKSEDVLNPHTFYWATGTFSSVFDNTPTYLNMLAAAVAQKGLRIEEYGDVAYMANNFPMYVKAISIGAVFFGAMTYIGNAPNFMVKSIAAQQGIHMPSFLSYVVRYSIPYLLPVLLIIWLLVFVLLN